MTSISPQVLPSQQPTHISKPIVPAHSPSASQTGRAPPQAAGTAPVKTSYASATRKAFSPPLVVSGSAQSASGQSQHASTIPSVNGKVAIPPAVPSVGNPAAVNGNPSNTSSSGRSDHVRKPSVTISAAGAPQNPQNGAPLAGKPPGSSSIQFGSYNADGSPRSTNAMPQQPIQSNSSLGVNNASNPRIVSPANSPSPIPQPPASGGKPPNHTHNPSVNFGQFGGQDHSVSLVRKRSFIISIANVMQMRSNMPSGPLAPGAQHLRRESSQSQHSDMSGHGIGHGTGRGGYPMQAGRGRGGYGPQQYQQQMPYSPQSGFRQPPGQNQQSGRPGMPYQQSSGRGSYGPGPYPNSPHQAARSPVPPHAQPAPSQGQMPMANPNMGPQYGGYPQYGYPQGMGQQVAPTFSSSPSRKLWSPEEDSNPKNRRGSFSKRGNPSSRARHGRSESRDVKPSDLPNWRSRPRLPLPPPPFLDLSPSTGNFEAFLTAESQAYMGQQGYMANPAYQDQFYGYYNQPGYGPPMQGMPSQSPRPPHMTSGAPQGYGGQYGGMAPSPMSRTSSHMSIDRPNSSMGKSQPSNSIPAASTNTPIPTRPAASPAPKPTKDFQIPVKKSAGIVIRNPGTGDIVDLKKPSPSPAPSSKSPAKSPAPASTAATPPPGSASQEAQVAKTDSKISKTDEEKRAEMKDAIAKKLEADKAEEQNRKDEAKLAADKKESDAKAAKEKAEADKKALEDAEAKKEADEAEIKKKTEAKEALQAAEEAKASEKEDAAAKKAREDKEMEDEMARWEAEDAERERIEAEAEKAYAIKKQQEKDEAARKEAEAFKMADDEMKKAEREAEAAEEKRLKELEDGEDADSHKDSEETTPSFQKEESPATTDEPHTSGEPKIDSKPASPAPEAMAAPKSAGASSKQKPAALKLETAKSVEAPQPTPQLLSLRSARKLTYINDVSYPSPIHSPNPALNTSAPPMKFKYDRDFLMQFQRAFTEKPSENWAERLKETVGDGESSSARTPARGGGGSSMGMSGRQNSSTRAPLPQMGAFAQNGRTIPPGTTSQARFEASSRGGTAPAARPTMSNPLASFVSGRPGGFPQPGAAKMDRTPSTTSFGAHPNSPRNASQRGGSQRGSRANTRKEDPKDNKAMPLTAGANLKPIEVTSSGWKPRSVGAAANMSGPAPGGDGLMAPDVVQRKVKSNLNKMTPNNFDKISGQILAIAHQSKDETDGRSLRQVIQLTFEKATDEAHWAEMYAQFCKRMLEAMSPEIKDESIRDKNGAIVTGGALFRKYLLTRCQTEFERGWKMDLGEKPEDEEGEVKEVTMLSDEYYKAAAAKRRGLGLVRFIGELYKLQMLTERIMHECVKKLVDYESTPDEAEVESLTSLLKTIGGQLDNSEKGHQVMDVYFVRINQMIAIPDLPSRLRFMLMDIVDLRKANWQGKGSGVKGPTTLDAVRQQVSFPPCEEIRPAILTKHRLSKPNASRTPSVRQKALEEEVAAAGAECPWVVEMLADSPEVDKTLVCHRQITARMLAWTTSAALAAKVAIAKPVPKGKHSVLHLCSAVLEAPIPGSHLVLQRMMIRVPQVG